MIDLWRRLREQWLASEPENITPDSIRPGTLAGELSEHLCRDIGLGGATLPRGADPVLSQTFDQRWEPATRYIRYRYNYHPRMFLLLHRSGE